MEGKTMSANQNSINKYIELNSSLGKISLTKPTSWTLGSLKYVTGKHNLPKDEFIKAIVYYSQNNYENNKKFSFDEIKGLDSEEINALFVELINSDKILLCNRNEDQLVNNSNEAHKILTSYIEGIAKKMALHMVALMLSVSISGAWITALNGELNNESDNLLALSSCFNNISRDYPIDSQHLKHTIDKLKEFDSSKEKFLFICNRISLLIEKIRSFKMWIPSRYSTILINELIALDPTKLHKEQIETLIFKYTNSDIDKKILQDWKESILFRGREKMIEEGFLAHKQQLFAPSIAFFLTQLDNIIVEIAKFLNIDEGRRNANNEMLGNICDFIQGKIIDNIPISFFTVDIDLGNQIYLFQLKSLILYLRDITFKDTDKIVDQKDILNRHGVLHGKFLNYPNSINSIKLILLIDDLNIFFKNLPKHLKSN